MMQTRGFFLLLYYLLVATITTTNHAFAYPVNYHPLFAHSSTISNFITSDAQVFVHCPSYTTTSRRSRSSSRSKIAFKPTTSSAIFSRFRVDSRYMRSDPVTTLFQSSSNAEEEKKKKSKGVYARPSAAIERGSGFFVPGLEGSRVRVLFGILVLILAFVNHSVGVGDGGEASKAQNISDVVAAFYGVLLLIQAFSEIGRERGFGVDLSQEEGGDSVEMADEEAAVTTGGGLKQSASPLLENIVSNDEGIDSVRWVAASYVALTPATHVLLLGEDEIYYSLGNFDENSANNKKEGAKAALNDVFNSKGGRISIPSDHPASMSLLPESGRRCVLLQRIESEDSSKKKRLCIMIGSNQLLPAFTKNDLRWLGRLASYIGLHLK